MTSITKTNKSNKTKFRDRGLISAVGNTPLLPLSNIGSHLLPDVRIFAKAEWFNPGGSVKDRPAANIIRTALENGDLADGKILLDSTSGNMGISYAALGASLGVKVKLVVPENASIERFTILEALGAEVEKSDPLEGSDGAIIAAKELAESNPEKYFYADQYNNPANWQAHYQSTGPEIWMQTSRDVTHFVAGLGTSGTMTGVTNYLREQSDHVQSIAFQPDSPFHGLEGLKHMPSSIQPGIFDADLPDKTLEISTEKSYEMVRRLGREEGMFVGFSSGAAMIAALKIAEEIDKGVVVTVFPDAGYKYVSDNIWSRR